jgi:hypothetical protein
MRLLKNISFFLAIFVPLLLFQNCGSPKQFSASNPPLVDSSTDLPEETTATSCSFDGEEIPDGRSVSSYQNSTVPAGSSCKSEERVCEKGNLSGSYNYALCLVDAEASCLFNGRTIAPGESVTAYLNADAVTGACVSESRKCTNGALSGSYSFASCDSSNTGSCTFNGRSIANHTGVKAYLAAATPAGTACTEETRTCTNGTLSGSYNFSSCTPGQFATCSFNGKVLAHGESTMAFQNSTVAFGMSCVQEARVCNNGALSGSYNFSACTPNAPAMCSFNGQSIAHGQSVTAYPASSVPFGQSCAPTTRTCNNGLLSGSGPFATCNVGAAKSCVLNGRTYAHGESVKMFTTSTVAFGQTCTSQTRTCNDGTMSGTAAFASCNPDAPASCLFNGQTVAHGQSVAAYSATSVPNGQSCSAVMESRMCSNGSLSGSFPNSSCTVAGLVSTGVTVRIACSVSAANSQVLKVTLANGSTKSWTLGNGEKTVTPFNETFTSAPTLFQAYSNGNLSSHRYSNQTATTLKFESEDGRDNDFNDLICNFSW